MSPKLIVALDFNTQNEALSLVDQLEPTACALKVGSELFTLFGADFVKQLVDRHFNVFLDLKFHDIPNTVAKACQAGADLGVWMMNIHASGGLQMMKAANKALEPYGKDKPLLIAVTVLTSFSEADLVRIGVVRSVLEHVKNLAILSQEAGLDGVVSSAYEVAAIKEVCGLKFISVTPGIMLATGSKDDQSRVMTPQHAMKEGSDYLVIGRPITQSSDPALVVSEILRSITSS